MVAGFDQRGVVRLAGPEHLDGGSVDLSGGERGEQRETASGRSAADRLDTAVRPTRGPGQRGSPRQLFQLRHDQVADRRRHGPDAAWRQRRHSRGRRHPVAGSTAQDRVAGQRRCWQQLQRMCQAGRAACCADRILRLRIRKDRAQRHLGSPGGSGTSVRNTFTMRL